MKDEKIVVFSGQTFISAACVAADAEGSRFTGRKCGTDLVFLNVGVPVRIVESGFISAYLLGSGGSNPGGRYFVKGFELLAGDVVTLLFAGTPSDPARIEVARC